MRFSFLSKARFRTITHDRGRSSRLVSLFYFIPLPVMQSVRKQEFTSAPVRAATRGDAKPSDALSADNKTFVRAKVQAGSVDKTALQSRTAQAMNNLTLAGMSKEGTAIAQYCRGLPSGTELDLHTSINPYIRDYAAGLAATSNTPGPLFVKFDNGMLSVRSRSAEDSFPIFAMHPTSGGVGYTLHGRPLNGSSSFPEVEMGQSHLSLCRLVAQEAVNPESMRRAVAADQA